MYKKGIKFSLACAAIGVLGFIQKGEAHSGARSQHLIQRKATDSLNSFHERSFINGNFKEDPISSDIVGRDIGVLTKNTIISHYGYNTNNLVNKKSSLSSYLESGHPLKNYSFPRVGKKLIPDTVDDKTVKKESVIDSSKSTFQVENKTLDSEPVIVLQPPTLKEKNESISLDINENESINGSVKVQESIRNVMPNVIDSVRQNISSAEVVNDNLIAANYLALMVLTKMVESPNITATEQKPLTLDDFLQKNTIKAEAKNEVVTDNLISVNDLALRVLIKMAESPGITVTEPKPLTRTNKDIKENPLKLQSKRKQNVKLSNSAYRRTIIDRIKRLIYKHRVELRKSAVRKQVRANTVKRMQQNRMNRMRASR